MIRLKRILQHRYFFGILAFCFILYSLFVYYFINFKSYYNGFEKSLQGTVNSYNINGDKLTIYLKVKEIVIVNYYFKSLNEKTYFEDNLKLGDLISVEGELEEPERNSVFNGFDYNKYLYNKHIYYLMNANNISIMEKNSGLLFYFKNLVMDRINGISKSKGYIMIFILGDKSFIDNEVKESYQNNGISHLFAVSGMHISLFAGIMLFFLKRVSYNNYFNCGMVCLFLLFYLFLAGFPASLLRASVMFILFSINKVFNLKISNLNILFMVIITILFIDPFYLFDIGFQFSYLISGTLIMMRWKIGVIKSKLKRSFYVSVVCFLVSFPICIYNFYGTNFISVLFNIFYIPFVSIIVFPLSLITFVFPFLDSFLYSSIFVMERISLFISSINFGYIIFPKVNFCVYFIYYIVIFLSFWKIEFVLLFLVMLLIHKGYIYFNSNLYVYYLDVGQGDSALIRLPNNSGNILIDTGGKFSYEMEKWREKRSKYSIVKSSTIPFLKSFGIKKLDYLILSHGDFDHMGEAINLIDNFNVEKVIFNCGEFNDLEKELIKVLDKKKIRYYLCIKELNIDNNELYFLQTKEYDNENDNSNVIYTELNGYKFMFMGDAGVDKEKDILDKYNLSNVDVLKVGHHGSKTSSSKSFINEINPKNSIISVGKNNRYGHPNKEVLYILEDSKIYRTDQDGSIMCKIKKNKLRIETYSP